LNQSSDGGILYFFRPQKTLATLTASGLFTGLFAESHDQGVVFIVNGNIGRQGIHKNLLQNIVMQRSVKVQMPLRHPIFFIRSSSE